MKCRWIVRCVNLIEAHDDADEVASFDAIVAALPKDEVLGPTLRRLIGHMTASEELADILQRAREARNLIAHEGAGVGDISVVRERHILEHAARLRSGVRDLAAGRNIVSQWGYHLEEWRQSLPWDLINAYPKVIDDWVSGHFGDRLEASHQG
ncbi:hypothetical protein [Streptomyces griseosporeus]|uniref:hypothetical protein n=1 Tax=Streptomyces griseosporeus TaxID=1910 RepID=UPI00167C5DED|nr:hypothetical protein [Streptomyces griseosporeus]GHF36377.1 hypothetical protein GCM10018783_00850 [Streptomyces griseosporeus]